MAVHNCTLQTYPSAPNMQPPSMAKPLNKVTLWSRLTKCETKIRNTNQSWKALTENYSKLPADKALKQRNEAEKKRALLQKLAKHASNLRQCIEGSSATVTDSEDEEEPDVHPWDKGMSETKYNSFPEPLFKKPHLPP